MNERATFRVEAALGESVLDPSIAPARTGPEAALVQNLISRGAVVSFDRGTGIDIVRSQILVAQGHKLHDDPIHIPKQDSIKTSGYAIQLLAQT